MKLKNPRSSLRLSDRLSEPLASVGIVKYQDRK